MNKIHLSQIAQASSSEMVGITNGSGIQGYKHLNSDTFLVSSDINVKLASFINDEEGSNKPTSHSVPSTLPSNPSLNATLLEIFDDYFVYWKWNGATWSPLSTQDRYHTLQLSYSLIGTSAANIPVVVPTFLNGWKIAKVCAYNTGSSNISSSQIMKKNNVAFGPSIAINSNLFTCANDGTSTIATGDLLSVNESIVPSQPAQLVITLTLQKP